MEDGRESASTGPDASNGAFPALAIVGAGAVGTALGLALSRAGLKVAAVVSRDAGRRARFRSLVPQAQALVDATELADDIDLVILTVPDDAVAAVSAAIAARPGRTVAHTSGALGADLLARTSGRQGVGAFHPLVSFTADVERSAAALAGATIAIEGDPRTSALLSSLATAIGGVPLLIPAGGKAAYHAAAVLASGGLVALLDTIVEIGRAAGLEESASLAVYGRLIDQTLANVKAGGVAAALTGPITRGDAGTIEAHLDAISTSAPDALALYLAAAWRELRIAEERRALSPEQAARVGRVLAKGR